MPFHQPLLNTEIKKKMDEGREELLQIVVADLREKKISQSRELILPFNPGLEFPGIEISVPDIRVWPYSINFGQVEVVCRLFPL